MAHIDHFSFECQSPRKIKDIYGVGVVRNNDTRCLIDHNNDQKNFDIFSRRCNRYDMDDLINSIKHKCTGEKNCTLNINDLY